jgi:hypothetical protein
MAKRDPDGVYEPCRHPVKTWRVASHTDLTAAATVGDGMASVLVCERRACVDDAMAWVDRQAARTPVVTPLNIPDDPRMYAGLLSDLGATG